MESLFNYLGWIMALAPLFLFLALGIAALAKSFRESWVCHLTQWAVGICLVACVVSGSVLIYSGKSEMVVKLGDWVQLPVSGFHFNITFIFDTLSISFATLTLALCGAVGSFGRIYLHRDPGFQRFFLFYALFLMGMLWSSFSGTIETLFIGWELVGLSSALLVAFFHERPSPVRNGLYVWVVYRVGDAAFLVAAVTLHHMTGGGDFNILMGEGAWPNGTIALTSNQILAVGSLLLIAVAAKSALIPFSGWLPRAMEGPTPSSAIFYGALSVHLGAFLLLRISGALDASFTLSAMVTVIGLLTAVYATIAIRVQTDIKSALSFASLTQIGIIVAEIGLGFRYLALAHIIGHASLRTLQFLRAPTLLHDYHEMENAIGDHLQAPEPRWIRLLSPKGRERAYRYAMDRGHWSQWLDAFITQPFIKLFQTFDRWERNWARLLGGDDEVNQKKSPKDS